MPSTDIPFTLRIPVGLNARLRDRAAKESRSLNWLIVWLLERSVSDDTGRVDAAWIANEDHP